MSAKSDTRLAVLKVLAGQSPDYWIFPNAAAFAAEGLDPVDVAETLDELHGEGRLEREQLPPDDPDGDGAPLPGGYRLLPTDQPKKKKKEEK